MNWFLLDNNLRHERVKQVVVTIPYLLYQLHFAVGATPINQFFQQLFPSAAIS